MTEVILELRRSRKLFAWQIALGLGMARSTVIRVLRRSGLQRLSSIAPPPTFKRYEFAAPGQLVHIDIKKLAKFETQGHRIDGVRHKANQGLGSEHVYVCVDDASRVAFVEVREREDRFEAAAFLRNAIRWFRARDVRIERVMTDNGKVFLSRDFRNEILLIGAKHHRTPMYTPRVNGKAERFIRTLLGECAYGIAFANSTERRAGLVAWNRFYNEERPHSALNYRPPASRLKLV
jgi:transposase InsO family protein